MSTSLASKIVAAIANGKLDKQLQAIDSAVRGRRRVLVEIRAASIEEGDEVVFCHSGKPHYLKGKKARVVEVLDGPKYHFLVEILSFTGAKYTSGSRVNVSAMMVKKEE